MRKRDCSTDSEGDAQLLAGIELESEANDRFLMRHHPQLRTVSGTS